MKFSAVFRSYAMLGVPALVYLLATVYACYRGDDRLVGDEPYYLITAESIVQDADVDLKNNHEKHNTPPGASHCIMRESGWFNVHNLGLSALVTLPWTVAGPLGARLTLALFAGLAAPLLFQVINSVCRQPSAALPIALALSLTMWLVHASSQIFPDLPAGIVLLFLAGRALAEPSEPPALRWRDLSPPIALAFLPWLHLKYVGPALVVLMWIALAARWKRSLLNVAALAGSLALLGCYNRYAFGRAIGPYGHGSLLAEMNSFNVFMGLHFDQAQGMFLQQPLWLLGLIGLAPMWRASWRIGTCWSLLYISAILPNAMHPNWYGADCYIGRFGATAVLLWAVPLAFAVRTLFAIGSRAPSMLAVASIAVQLCQAPYWLTAGDALLYPWDRPELWRPCVWAYNGFVPYFFRDYLPYWQPFVKFWHYPANFAALMVACGLLTFGLCFAWRRRLAWGCLLGTTLAAVLLLAAVPVKSPQAVCTGDHLFDWGQAVVGQKIGTARVAVEGVDGEGVVGLANRLFVSPGEYEVAVDYLAQGATGPVGYVSYYDGRNYTTLATLNGEDGPRHCVSLLRVRQAAPGRGSAINVMYTGRGTLGIARLAVERLR